MLAANHTLVAARRRCSVSDATAEYNTFFANAFGLSERELTCQSSRNEKCKSADTKKEASYLVYAGLKLPALWIHNGSIEAKCHPRFHK